MNDGLKIKVRSLLADSAESGGVGAAYHGLHAVELLVNDRVCDFCSHCLHHDMAGRLCRYASCSSAMASFRSGEPAIQRCWAGLVYVTVAIVENESCVGGVSVGGFCFEGENPRIGVREAIASFPAHSLGSFEERVISIRSISPGELRGYADYMMELTYSSGINSEQLFVRQNNKYQQQRSIAQALEELEKDGETGDDFVSDAQQILTLIDQGDRANVEFFFSQYLARLLRASNWNIGKVKARLRLLVAILTSREMLNGVDWNKAAGREARRLLKLEEAMTVEDSCYEVAEMIMSHLGGEEASDPDVSLSDRIILWLEEHYSDRFMLKDIARSVGASESAVIKSIKRATGKTSRQLLRDMRVAEARRLLASTNLELSEISHRCGFYDQSHFTREFKQVTNLTPGMFRRLGDVEQMRLG